MSDGQTILLTGFKAFPGVPVNVTQALVPRVAAAARRRFARHRIATRVLPTEWVAAPKLLDSLLAKHDPDLILHFGVDGTAVGFEIETQGFNECRSQEDAAGALPLRSEVVSGACDRLVATLPVAAIVARLAALGIAARASDDAGRYLCNFVLYRSLHAAATRPGVRAGFVHMPPVLSDAGLSERQAHEGALEIIAACLEARTN